MLHTPDLSIIDEESQVIPETDFESTEAEESTADTVIKSATNLVSPNRSRSSARLQAVPSRLRQRNVIKSDSSDDDFKPPKSQKSKGKGKGKSKGGYPKSVAATEEPSQAKPSLAKHKQIRK